MKKALLSSFVFLIYIAGFAQVLLPQDTTIACGSSITVHSQTLSAPANCTGTYQINSIPFDSTLFLLPGTSAFTNPADDKYSDTINVPFIFSYFGNQYNKLIISNNGYLTFDVSLANAYAPWSFTVLAPSGSLPLNAIFGIFHDLYLSHNGSITFSTQGFAPNRKFVILFSQVALYSCTSINSSTAIVLNESTNIIEVHTLQKSACPTWNNGNSLLGIQNQNGTVAYVPPGRNTGNWSTNNESWQFAPTEPSDSFYLQWYINDSLAGIGDSVQIDPIDSLVKVRAEMISFCSGISTFTAVDEMLISPISSIAVSPTDTTVCEGDTVQIVVSGVDNAIWNTGDTTLQNTITVNNDTNLLIWSYDSAGCYSSVQTAIHTNPTPATPVISFNSQTNTLFSSINGVQWFQLIPEDSLIGFGDSITVSSNGTYFAILTDSNGCYARSSNYNVITVALNENSDMLATVFPNPSDGFFKVNFPEKSTVFEIQIINLMGEVVAIVQIPESSSAILISDKNIKDGYYRLVFKSNQLISSIPLIIQH